MQHQGLAFEQWPPLRPIQAPEPPPEELKRLIEEYGFGGYRTDSLVDTVKNNRAWSFREIQLGSQWAEYLMKNEIAKVEAKVKYRNDQHGAGFTTAQAKEIESRCQTKMREYTPSPTGMVGVDLGPITNALAKRVQGIIEVKGMADTQCGV